MYKVMELWNASMSLRPNDMRAPYESVVEYCPLMQKSFQRFRNNDRPNCSLKCVVDELTVKKFNYFWVFSFFTVVLSDSAIH